MRRPHSGRTRPDPGAPRRGRADDRGDRHRIVQSMSRKAGCWDNVVVESLYKALEFERVDHVPYRSRQQA